MSAIQSANSKDQWLRRVQAATGLEMLYERHWRLLASSERIWRESRQPAELHLGKSLWDYPFLRPGLPTLESFGLFDGKLFCLKLSIQLAFDGVVRTRDLDFWPVLTNEDEFLVHLTGVTREAPSNYGAGYHGFRVLDLRPIGFDDPSVASGP